ncbi:phosphoribosylglycinamide formyltransferase [Dictyocaulus viviparus]|uniref:phosphoribosylglycinamide formyltransferase 1 n=1 Tax=Dictyocaulus viviparus TaxID=29172 RepID=A0A0D8Y205_DICVI|nr:phosphoribosylglycinamide formyltransferase [Dictyocaulus viviparus]
MGGKCHEAEIPDNNDFTITYLVPGIGIVLVVGASDVNVVKERLIDAGETPVEIGSVVKKQGSSLINFTNLDIAFDPSRFLSGPKPKVKVGILISGAGSNMEKLVKSSRKPNSHCEVVVVISNKAGAKGLEIARAMGVEAVVIAHTPIREEGDSRITEVLRSRNVELICLAGYMRVLSPSFIQEWPNSIINVHPSILPSFKGSHAIQDALKFGAKVTGCTVHYVDEQIDHGGIIAQRVVPIDDEDDEVSLRAKIQKLEYELYPEVMQKLARMYLQQKNLIKDH